MHELADDDRVRSLPGGNWPGVALSPTEDAVLRTLVYADLFDFPLEREEIYSFCVAPGGSAPAIDAAVESLAIRRLVDIQEPFVSLSRRSETVALRRTRADIADRSWRSARFWARCIWAMPFVRMVAITGSLAAHNVDPDGDIDFMIVVIPGRVWLTRALCLLMWRVTKPFGARLCPNYFVTTRALTTQSRNLYAAREMAQMAPLHGWEIAARMWASNRWVSHYLPNAHLDTSRLSDTQSVPVRFSKALGEGLLGGRLADRFEAWECRRKTARLAAQVSGTMESEFSADVCKHHAHAHGERILRAYAMRLAELHRSM